MIKTFSRISRRRPSRSLDICGSVGSFLPLAIFFLAGALLGSILTVKSPVSDMSAYFSEIASSKPGAISFLSAFWDGSLFLLLLLLAASSLAGVLAAPLILAFRGYLLSCTASSIIMNYPEQGWTLALILLGIPAIFSLPCAFFLGMDAMASSVRLISLASGGSKPVGRVEFLRHLFLCIPAVLVGAAVETTLMPYLINLMI